MRNGLALIVAVSSNGVIGRGGDLPWRLRDDLAHFKRMTLGHCLIMGRKTWESLPGALPGRTSIVITRDPSLEIAGVEIATGIEDAIAIAAGAGDLSPRVAGGAEIYALALPHAWRMWLTRVHAEVEGDVYFPEWDEADWECVNSLDYPASARNEYAFTIEEWLRR